MLKLHHVETATSATKVEAHLQAAKIQQFAESQKWLIIQPVR
jgi:hypothetical protein